MTIILGINYVFHDSSACLIRNGVIVHAVEEERLSRSKHSQDFPILAVTECLRQLEGCVEDLEHIAISVNPAKFQAEKLRYAAGLGANSAPFLTYEFDRLNERHLKFWQWFRATWPEGKNAEPKVHFVDHHEAHAVGTFLVSPWEHAALLSVDGWGEWGTTWLGHASEQVQIRTLS